MTKTNNNNNNTSDTVINITMIPIDLLEPNTWNPNRMSSECFEQLTYELKRMRKPPKPIVVRPDGDTYLIIDGEHSYRAAKAIGLTALPCEIEHVDDFEAMLETFKRNESGENNPVLLGRMFRRMQRYGKGRKKLSNAELARKMKISEGKVRYAMQYADAAETRNSYVNQDSAEEIGRLPVRHIRIYLSLPLAIRDAWLDAGGHTWHVENDYYDEEGAAWRFLPVVDAGLQYMFAGKIDFRKVAVLSVQYCDWLNQQRGFPGCDDYVRSAASRHLPVAVMDLLPIQVVDGQAEACLPVETWDAILERCAGHRRQTDQLHAIAAAVRVALRDAGIDPQKVYSPEIVERVQIVQAAPEYIRDADHLTLEEQYMLTTLDVNGPDGLLDEAKRLAVAHLAWHRAGQDGDPPAGVLADNRTASVAEMVYAYTRHLLRQQQDQVEADLLIDRDRLISVLVSILGTTPAIRDGVVDGQPAQDVLRDSLQAINDPELRLLAGCAMGSRDAAKAAEWWLEAYGGEIVATEEAAKERQPPSTSKPARQATQAAVTVAGAEGPCRCRF